jgi:hypothetical protein
MAQAKERLADDADNQKDPIKRFKAAYADLLDEARISAEHTATEGWQKLYAAHRESLRVNRRRLSERLKQLADTMEFRGLDEESEKSLADIRKESAEMRETHEAFESETVGPVMLAGCETQRSG